MTPTVELDDVTTWPAPFRDVVEASAADADEDSWFSSSDDAVAVAALMGYRLRAYHCTRLTPREVNAVRSDGLRPLSPEFTRERLSNVVADHHLTEQEAALYAKTTLPSAVNRAGRVSLFTDRASLASAPQIGYLVEFWGGRASTWPSTAALRRCNGWRGLARRPSSLLRSILVFITSADTRGS
jgi:hypothetical protein